MVGPPPAALDVSPGAKRPGLGGPPAPGAKRPVTRRRALSAGALAGVVLSGCGAHAPHAKRVSTVTRSDIPLLLSLLALEYRTVAAYEAGIPLLAPGSDVFKAAQQFLLQDEAHVGELQGLLKKAGLKPPPRQPLTPGLGEPRDPTEVLSLLQRLENATIAAYLAALPQISDGGVRQAFAGVLANDAQHVAVLRESLDQPPVNAALVTGRS